MYRVSLLINSETLIHAEIKNRPQSSDFFAADPFLHLSSYIEITCVTLFSAEKIRREWR